MRRSITALAAMALALPAATPFAAPALAQPAQPKTVYQFGGKSYATLEECLRAKKRSKDRATVAGAAVAGVGAALLGGNVGETALVAGAGALAGREIAKATSKKQC